MFFQDEYQYSSVYLRIGRSVGDREVGMSFLLLSALLASPICFLSCVATAPIPVSLWLGSCVVGLSMGMPLLNGI